MSEHVSDDFIVGDVVSKSFSVLFKNLIPFGLICVLIYLPFVLLSLYFVGDPLAVENITLDTTALYGSLGMTLIYFIFIYVAYGAITFGTIRSLQERQVSLGEVISKGFSKFFPVLGVAIVSAFVIGLGLVVFIVPGVIIALMIYVAIPAVVVERVGVFESLSRSAALTKGFKGKILGLALLVALINLGVGMAIGIFTFAGTALYLVADLIFTSFSLAFGAVVVAVAYQELRRIKEGVDIDTIAAVFS